MRQIGWIDRFLQLSGPADPHELVSGRTLVANAGPGHRLSLAADQAVVLVELPLGGKAAVTDGWLMVGGITVDHRARTGR